MPKAYVNETGAKNAFRRSILKKGNSRLDQSTKARKLRKKARVARLARKNARLARLSRALPAPNPIKIVHIPAAGPTVKKFTDV